MASVWDTLNAMKSRQQAATQTAQKHRQNDLSRREATLFFESTIHAATSVEDVFVRLNESPAVRAVVDAHKQRFAREGKDSLEEEIDRVRDKCQAASAELCIAAQALQRANGAVHRIM